MLRADQNTFATETGPGTPMGNLFRRYWIPALHASELPENECPPVRVKLLSERLLAWRDTQGRSRADRRVLRAPRRLAVVRQERAERAALPLSRLEIRPHRPVHRGAVGAERKRLLPEDQAEVLSADRAGRNPLGLYGTARAAAAVPGIRMGDGAGLALSTTRKRLQECNYLQAMEGGIDSSHVSFLHSGDMHRDPLHRNTKGAHYQSDQKPKFEIVEFVRRAVHRARAGTPRQGHYYWRITQWIMPWYTMVPPYGDNALNAHAWVPIDDENCFTWTFTYHPTRPLSRHGARRDAQGRRHPCASWSPARSGRSSTRTTTT